MEAEAANTGEAMETESALVSSSQSTFTNTTPSFISDAARIAWEHANEVNEMSDEHLRYNVEVHQSIVNAKPWTNNPHYFKSIKISAVALLKMLLHAHSGGTCEVIFV